MKKDRKAGKDSRGTQGKHDQGTEDDGQIAEEMNLAEQTESRCKRCAVKHM